MIFSFTLHLMGRKNHKQRYGALFEPVLGALQEFCEPRERADQTAVAVTVIGGELNAIPVS
ncbi:MAG: hypothetical protein AAFS02_07705 [Pseudomonadota bacterium]